jgi:hypothetical protein
MKITKQRLKEIIRAELNEIMPEPDLAPDRELRREIKESKKVLAAAMEQFVQLQNEQPGTRPEWGPRMLRKFVDNWIMERS